MYPTEQPSSLQPHARLSLEIGAVDAAAVLEERAHHPADQILDAAADDRAADRAGDLAELQR
jgi:hypothetical protein